MTEWPIKAIPSGESFWRVSARRWGGVSFNPNQGANSSGGRFHPFCDKTSLTVPTLYMADHPNGAFSETLLRPKDEKQSPITINQIEKTSLYSIRSENSLRLIDLSHTEISEQTAAILTSGADSYFKARTLAATLHAFYDHIHGLCWNGSQLGIDGMACIVLFGDRFESTGVLTEIHEYPLDRGEGLEKMRKASKALGLAHYLPVKYTRNISMRDNIEAQA